MIMNVLVHRDHESRVVRYPTVYVHYSTTDNIGYCSIRLSRPFYQPSSCPLTELTKSSHLYQYFYELLLFFFYNFGESIADLSLLPLTYWFREFRFIWNSVEIGGKWMPIAVRCDVWQHVSRWTRSARCRAYYCLLLGLDSDCNNLATFCRLK